MTQLPVAVFKIPTESPQQAHGKASRARKAAAAQPKAATRTAGRVASSETRAATRGDGQGMTLARDLLLDQDTTLAEIAERVGYSSLYAFAAAFRRHHGQPPGRWRQRQALSTPAGIPGH